MTDPASSAHPVDGHSEQPGLTFRAALCWALFSAACFQIAQLVPYAGFILVAFFVGLLNLTRLNNARHAFRWGIALGWMVYAPQLAFFWKVFVPAGSSGAAMVMGGIGVFALWMVLPIWLGLFLCLATWLRRWTKPGFWMWLIPMAWTGIEYFRSELYPLKFSWLSAGYSFAGATWMIPLRPLGMFGVGFLLMLLAVLAYRGWKRSKLATGLMLIGAGYALIFLGSVLAAQAQATNTSQPTLPIGGVQLEFPSNTKILQQLDRLIGEHSETKLCVLSEYTFNGPVPRVVRDWCRDNERYLIAGGKDALGKTNFYNTALVVGPDGEIVFKQVKSVPIQFFKDGLPAPEQKVWDSPWGKLGLCICYDLGYSRVTDELVRQGAEAIIAPTMDVADWGGQQHWLHSHVAPIRAAEYDVPIFRLTSSGISQYVLPSGKVAAARPFPGQEELLAVEITPSDRGRLPIDRWLAPSCVIFTALAAIIAAAASTRRWLVSRRKV